MSVGRGRLRMRIEHAGDAPQVDDSAYVAETATLSGDVTVAPGACVLHGAVLNADGGPVRIGGTTVVMEGAVLRGTARHPLTVGEHVLVGPGASLSGCTVGDHAFLATAATVFNGATVGAGAEVRVRGTVHVNTALEHGAVVPIGWVAVGDPADTLPPGDHDAIWERQEPLDFPGTVFGLERAPPAELMPRLTERYAAHLRGHRDDRVLER